MSDVPDVRVSVCVSVAAGFFMFFCFVFETVVIKVVYFDYPN